MVWRQNKTYESWNNYNLHIKDPLCPDGLLATRRNEHGWRETWEPSENVKNIVNSIFNLLFNRCWEDIDVLRECKLCQWHTSASATSLHSMLHPYLTINQCYEQIIFIVNGNSSISYIRSDGSLPRHCLRSHSNTIKFKEDLGRGHMQLTVIWRRQHNMMRGYIAGGMRTLITSHCGRFIFNMAVKVPEICRLWLNIP